MGYTNAGKYDDVFLSAVSGKPLTLTDFTVYEEDGVTLSTLWTNAAKGGVASAVGAARTDSRGNGSFYATPGAHVIVCNGVSMTVHVPPDPTEVDNISVPWAARPKTSGGTVSYGLPGVSFVGVLSTWGMAANREYSMPFVVGSPITVDDLACEVTTAVAGNIRFAIYPADLDWQPQAVAPLWDSGDINVGSTGVKTAAVPNVTLRRGLYVLQVNSSTTATLRALRTGANLIGTGMNPVLGASPFLRYCYSTRTYAAFPTPGQKWDTTSHSTVGIEYCALLRWTPETTVS